MSDFRQNLQVPGFRKGKVPESLIKQRFAKELEQEVLSKLVPKSIDEAIRQENLNPVERPTLDDVSFEKGQPLKINASFEIRPQLALENYSGLTLKVDKNKYKVTDTELDEQIEMLRQRAATFVPVEDRRPVAKGDFVVIDFRGEPQAEDAIPYRREEVRAEVVEAEADGGFTENLIGSRAGQKVDFTVDYPADFREPAVSGSSIRYEVEVKEIKERILPDLDDDFARDLGQFESLGELRKEVRNQLEGQKARERRADVERKLIEAVLKKNPDFELPQVMVQRRLAAADQQMRRHMLSRGINPDHIGFDWTAFREAERPEAEFGVKEMLVLDEIAERENVRVSGKEIRAEIDAVAASSDRDPNEVRREMMTDGSYEAIQAHLRDIKVKDWLIENNVVEEG
jgi:trigger factor